jgi:hypothetical protein
VIAKSLNSSISRPSNNILRQTACQSSFARRSERKGDLLRLVLFWARHHGTILPPFLPRRYTENRLLSAARRLMALQKTAIFRTGEVILPAPGAFPD